LIFDELARRSHEAISIIGFFGRFEIVRTEKNQSRAKPLKPYQKSDRLSTYSRPWKQLLSFFIRTQEGFSSEKFPEYHFTKGQRFFYSQLIRLASRVKNLEDLREKLKSDVSLRNSESESSLEGSSSEFKKEDKEEEDEENTRIPVKNSRKLSSLTTLEKALLDFTISLLDQSTSEDEYDLALVDALAVLGVQQNRFRGVDSYPSILSSILKTSRFLVLRYSFENSSRISTTRGKEIAEDSDSSTSSTPEQLFSGLDLGEGPLSRLKTLVNRFLIRGTRTPID